MVIHKDRDSPVLSKLKKQDTSLFFPQKKLPGISRQLFLIKHHFLFIVSVHRIKVYDIFTISKYTFKFILSTNN